MQTIAPKLMAEDSANNFSQNSGSEENSPPLSASSTPTGAEAQVLEGPFQRMEVCETSHSVKELPEPEHTTQPMLQPTQPVLQPTQPVPQPTQPVLQASLPIPHPPRVGLQYELPTKPSSRLLCTPLTHGFVWVCQPISLSCSFHRLSSSHKALICASYITDCSFMFRVQRRMPRFCQAGRVARRQLPSSFHTSTSFTLWGEAWWMLQSAVQSLGTLLVRCCCLATFYRTKTPACKALGACRLLSLSLIHLL